METNQRWDALPEECKSMILARLSTKEVARIARVSKEFLRAVNVMRSSVQLLVLPPTLSVSALEYMVASHPNVRSLSFRRCGMKLKTFVPIIKAAASGNVTVVENRRLDSVACEKKKVRSLTAIDFRNCVHLMDTDISILCSLHSRLEEVDLTNCPFMTDATLLTLSRYQHVEKQSDPLEKYSYPRFLEKSSKVTSGTFTELDEEFLKNNDAAVFEQIQGLGLNSNNIRSWPRIGGSMERPRKEIIGHPQASSRKYEEGKIVAASAYSNMSRRRDSNIPATQDLGLKKSYAQIAGKPVQKSASCSVNHVIEKSTSAPSSLQYVKPAELHSALSCIENIDSGPFSMQSSKSSDLDPTLTFIDWTLCDLSNKTGKSDSQSLRDMGLFSSSEYCSTSSTSVVPDDKSNMEMAARNRYRDMYERYLIDEVENPTCALPDLIGKLCLSPAHSKDLIQTRLKPMVVQVNDSGSKYNTVETAIRDNRMIRTQTSVFIPKLSQGGLALSKQKKTVCVAIGTEIRDQRVQFDPSLKSGGTPNCSSEAFCRTTSHVGVFAVPDTGAEGRFHVADLDKICESTCKGKQLEGLRDSSFGEIENISQMAICLPDAANIGGILRRNMQPLQSPDCQMRTSPGSGKNMASESHLDVEIDIFRNVPGLRTLCVAGCPNVTDRGVQALLKGASRTCLSTLDVSRCGSITNAGLRLPERSSLQHLIAVQMPAISRLVYQLPNQSVLQHLNLAGCYKLEELMLVVSSLKTLNLSNCKKLTQLHLKCPSLSALNLSLCDGLERFIKFQCSSLQSLNFMGCRMLLQSALNSAVESAASLEDLRCGGCDHIERLDLVQPTLLTLDVSGSQSLKRLFCQSKILRSVDACGCKTLAEVYLYSPCLRRMLFSNCALLQILVIPLDAIKETMDTAVAQGRRAGNWKQDELEISISGCNMPEIVKKNLAKLMKQWHCCFKSATSNLSRFR